MPPKPKYTKQEVTDAALQLLRREGLTALTARNIARELNTSPSAIFTHFDSMEQVVQSAVEEGRAIYARYAEAGLAMTPPFKGFGIQFIRFATREPWLFYTLFLKRDTPHSIEDILLSEGHWQQILDTIRDTFQISEDTAKKLYDHLWIYVCGIASLSAAGVCDFSEAQISRMLGDACRSFCIGLTLPKDLRTETVPRPDGRMEGSVETYLFSAERE